MGDESFVADFKLIGLLATCRTKQHDIPVNLGTRVDVGIRELSSDQSSTPLLAFSGMFMLAPVLRPMAPTV